MKRITIAILAFALAAIGAVFVFAQTDSSSDTNKVERPGKHRKFGKRGRRGMRGMRGMRRGGFMFRGLDLTDEQKTQIQSIMKASTENSKSLRDQMRTNNKELRKITENGNFDESQVQAIAQKQGEIHAQMIVHRQKVKADMYNVLTDEQKTKLAEKRAEFKKKMEERKAEWAKKRAEKKASQE